jgi:hypothetical protein
MASDDDTEESLTKQVLSMILENNAVRGAVLPYLAGWMIFNVMILILVIYISIRISLK